MPLRALGASGGNVFDIAQAIYYAAGESNNSGIRLTGNAIADVINMSLGGPDQNITLSEAISTAHAKGIIISAAGNESSSEPSYPAASVGVVSVSSVGADKALAPYSNFGSTIDIAALGGNSSADYNADGLPDGILSTDGKINDSNVDNVYTYLQGTSMASPHVAGVVALMKTVYPAMTPDIFDAWLAAGELTEGIGVAGRDNHYGHGLIDAYKAVITAKSAAVNNTAPLLYFTPNKIDFGLSNNSINIDVSNLGGEIPTPPSVQAPSDDADWLQVSISSVDSNGLGRYVAIINRNLLPSDGNYSATITFLTNTGNGTINIPVTAQRISSSQASNAGLIYILVLDPDTYTTIAGQAATVHNGVYSYYISSLPEDDFIIIAGSNSDNDKFICDEGESCGSYPLYGSSSIISVNDNITGIDFGVSYRVTLDSTASGFSKDINLQKSIEASR